MVSNIDHDYWSKRYQTADTGWDVGHVSTPLKEYFDQLNTKELSILIPGAGNAWEAEYLHHRGFPNVYLLDIAEEPIAAFKKRVPDFDPAHCLQEDFFKHSGQYDLIVEQTFFCALDPALRSAYVDKMSTLLKPGGKLCGLLFNIPLNSDKPPFGGNEQEYRRLFESKLRFSQLGTAFNSIAPRAGNELFFTAGLINQNP
ncbi:MAG: Thiopurine S-methyltransferase [Bacteroidetes bacterium]|jgi:SAM-dependent methyltransferase|nr:Thiopurine S-methyltransferase [Bacteroidota bacterium]